MKLKKSVAVVTAAMVLAGSFGTMGVMANNHTDEDWRFSVATGGNVYASKEGREKQDTSSCYMKCNTCTHTGGTTGSGNSYFGTAHGAVTKDSTYRNCIYNGKGSTTYSFTPGTTKYMTNYIKETSNSWAKIWCESGYTSYATFTGVWSPDSI